MPLKPPLAPPAPLLELEPEGDVSVGVPEPLPPVAPDVPLAPPVPLVAPVVPAPEDPAGGVALGLVLVPPVAPGGLSVALPESLGVLPVGLPVAPPAAPAPLSDPVLPAVPEEGGVLLVPPAVAGLPALLVVPGLVLSELAPESFFPHAPSASEATNTASNAEYFIGVPLKKYSYQLILALLEKTT